MIELIWRAIAWVVTRRPVNDWIVRRALRTPYSDIDGYMRRWWLFNPYPGHGGDALRRFSWCPISIRMHLILRADNEPHMHDHPWNARTIILSGSYLEKRLDGGIAYRSVGDTAAIKWGEFHKIVAVHNYIGTVTLFITGRYRGTWGFKIPYREYLATKR